MFFDANGLLLITPLVGRAGAASPQMSDLRVDQDQVVYYSYIFKEKLNWKKNGTRSDVQRPFQSNYLPII